MGAFRDAAVFAVQSRYAIGRDLTHQSAPFLHTEQTAPPVTRDKVRPVRPSIDSVTPRFNPIHRSRLFVAPVAIAIAIVGSFFSTYTASAETNDTATKAEQEAYFETHVRPLLIKHCVECHGPDDQSGELRLDRRSSAEKGGGSGPVIVPGQPQQSGLIRAIGYSDLSMQMPPDGKLPNEAIEVLTRWVQTGAHWPEETEAAETPSALSPAERIDDMRQTHWAYRPIESTPLPAVKNNDWAQQPLDQFILSRLEDSGLQPSEPADRRTLIHRVYFALIGLSPSYEEVESFVADQSPNAMEKLVDSLLDNQHYGERWARHWMDIARYAETTGYMGGSRETRYPYAYTYRDYLIDAFNDDKPYDQFVIEQLAADRLPDVESNPESLAALGFLTVGRRFMNRQHDIIDDRIDVVMRGFLGMTVACARCHDHKYDPIPTADYYSLYGVFASTDEPEELPLLGEPQPSKSYDAFLEEQGKKQNEVDDWLEETRVKTEDELRSRVADYLVYFAQTLPQYDNKGVKRQGKRGSLRPEAIKRWQDYLAKYAKSPHPIWSLWHRLSTIAPDQFSDRATAIFAEASDEPLDGISPRLLTALRGDPPKTMVDAAQRMGNEIEAVYAAWVEANKGEVKPSRLEDDADETIRQALYDGETPTSLTSAQMVVYLDQGQRNKHNAMLGKVKGVEVSHPGAPPRGMVLVDKKTPVQPVIFRRGQPGNRGDKVPRRFPQVLEHVDGGKPFSNGSGRLELANAIASPKNPLTARVIVNRIWQQQLGHGLVRTASDFGTRGDAPTHRELLDYLAAEFMADGWSIKRLQRRILLSSTWQQSSGFRQDAHNVDPENRLLWRMPRRRMEFEPLRDRLLTAAGRLDLSIGGRSVMIHQDAVRRGLYAYVDREDMPGLLASFDLPSPDASQAIRAQTTVPQQALFLLNAKFVIEQAEALAKRTADQTDATERIKSLYRIALSRQPDAIELETATTFINTPPVDSSDEPNAESGEKQKPKPKPIDPWTQLSQVLLLCNEFAFVD